LQLSRNLAATDLTYQVQRALEITGPWSNVATYTASAGWVANASGITLSESSATGAPPDQFVQAMITEQTPASTRAFFRALITQSP
jgi:hypothetical protein